MYPPSKLFKEHLGFVLRFPGYPRISHLDRKVLGNCCRWLERVYVSSFRGPQPDHLRSVQGLERPQLLHTSLPCGGVEIWMEETSDDFICESQKRYRTLWKSTFQKQKGDPLHLKRDFFCKPLASSTSRFKRSFHHRPSGRGFIGSFEDLHSSSSDPVAFPWPKAMRKWPKAVRDLRGLGFHPNITKSL